MLTKIVYDKYWRSWFLDDYKASSGEEVKIDLLSHLIRIIHVYHFLNIISEQLQFQT